jgi:hypothetical protein
MFLRGLTGGDSFVVALSFGPARDLPFHYFVCDPAPRVAEVGHMNIHYFIQEVIDAMNTRARHRALQQSAPTSLSHNAI